MAYVLNPTASERQNENYLNCWENCGEKGWFHDLFGFSMTGRRKGQRREIQQSQFNPVTDDYEKYRCWLACAAEEEADDLGPKHMALNAFDADIIELQAELEAMEMDEMGKMVVAQQQVNDEIAAILGNIAPPNEEEEAALLAELEALEALEGGIRMKYTRRRKMRKKRSKLRTRRKRQIKRRKYKRNRRRSHRRY